MFERVSPDIDAVSIGQQIGELERERVMRVTVYSRTAAGEPAKKSSLQYQMDCLDAAIRTLKWCRDNRAVIVAAKKQLGEGA